MNNFKFYLLLTYAVFSFKFNIESAAQSNTEKWGFHGVRISEKFGNCINDPYTKHESLWLPVDGDYNKKYNAYRDSIKVKYGGRFFMIMPVYVKTGEQRTIALIEKSVRCGAKNFSYYDGKDEADILEKAEKDKIEYKEILSYRIVYKIDCAAVTEQLAKERKGANTGISDNTTTAKANTAEKEYDGVIGKYTYVKQAKGNFTQVKLTNKRQDVIANVIFKLPGDKTVNDVIAPNATIQRQINSTDFSVNITFTPVKPGDNSPSVLEMVKKVVKDIITVKDGKVNTKYDPACMCIRG